MRRIFFFSKLVKTQPTHNSLFPPALISRVESAKQEHESLAAENQLLQKYINNSLTSTAVFGATGGALGGVAGTGQGIGVSGGMVAGGFVTRKDGGK